MCRNGLDSEAIGKLPMRLLLNLAHVGASEAEHRAYVGFNTSHFSQCQAAEPSAKTRFIDGVQVRAIDI